MILGHLVNREPLWLSRIIHHPLLSSVVKGLKVHMSVGYPGGRSCHGKAARTVFERPCCWKWELTNALSILTTVTSCRGQQRMRRYCLE